MEDPADPQQQRVYDMELGMLAGHIYHKMSLKRLQGMARKVCEQWDVEKVRVKIVGTLRSRGEYGDNLIELDGRQGCNALTLAHELAHHITVTRQPTAADHGPTFMRNFGEILAYLQIMPLESFRAAARLSKLRVR